MKTFTIAADGIATALFDLPGRSMNVLTDEAIADVADLAARLASDPTIRGLVIASGKPGAFCAGADLGTLGAQAGVPLERDEAALRARLDRVAGFSRALRALEAAGKPVAVALAGTALGGGLELALAAHHRVCADDPRIRLGLPEVKVGLLPGAGGTQRLPRLIGVHRALALMLDGRSVGPAEALADGILDRVVPPGQEVEAARAWIRDGGEGIARWDRKEFRPPGPAPYSSGFNAEFAQLNAGVHARTQGNQPAPLNILRCVYEGIQVPLDAGLRIEARYFLQTLASPQALAMTRTLFLSTQALAKGAARPAGIARSDPRRVAVLGAGMMGAGIAHVQALAGIDTVLVDVTREAAEKGRAHSRRLLDRAVGKGALAAAAADAAHARIRATDDYADLAGADLVVEAVFEDRTLKARVTAQAEAHLGPDAVVGSNTSSLPITGLAEASRRPANFIGIHFFSPVDRMDLVEVIRGQQTSDETLARVLDYVARLRKTPIVVRDSRGFYTTRCFVTFIDEGMEMLLDGIAPALIDNLGRAAGMPRGPLEMTDDVALDLVHKGRLQERADLGDRYGGRRTDALVAAMVETHGRHGRKNGRGFYDYPESGPKTLWPGLAGLAPVRRAEADAGLARDIRQRLLYRPALEAVRCLEEGVIAAPRDGDVGAVLGIGYAPWTGGPFSLIDSVGPAAFVEACDRLAEQAGPRFTPPALLRDMARDAGRRFYGPA